MSWSTTATDGWDSWKDDTRQRNPTAIEYKDNTKRRKRTKGFKSGNDYWRWFTKYGHDMFVAQFGEDYKDHRLDHNRFITSLWEAVKNEPGGWDAASRKMGMGGGGGGGGGRIGENVASKMGRVRAHPILPPEDSPPNSRRVPRPRRIHFSRNTKNEVDIRSAKVFTYLTSKLKIIMNAGVNEREQRNQDDVLRDLRCFVLIVHEYTSNCKGDKVAPAEVTLLTYSLSRGMQVALSRLMWYTPTLVTDGNLSEKEYGFVIESTDKTGIAVPRLTEQNGTMPERNEAYDVKRVKEHLLEFLTEGNKNAPIMVLKENYNEAAGMLFTLFPEYWERLDTRICFLDDMFQVYANVQHADSNMHPIRDYQNIPEAPMCGFHQKLKSRGSSKACTLSIGIRKLQILFKNLSDGRVLGMETLFDSYKHLICDDSYDSVQDGPQIDWDHEAREQLRSRDDLTRGGSDDDDSDDSFMPIISEQRGQSSGAHFGQQQQQRHDEDYGSSGRRDDSSQASSCGGGRSNDQGYGRQPPEYGREAAKENNWRQEPHRNGAATGGSGFGSSMNDRGNGYGSSSINNGGGSGATWNGFGNFNSATKLNGPPPGFEDREEREVRPAQRRRAPSPTYSDRGGKGGDGYDDDRGGRDSQDSRDGSRRNGSGEGSGRGGGAAGSFSRPRGGGGVFGSRPVIDQEPQQQPRTVDPQTQRRDVFSSAPHIPIPERTRYMQSCAGDDSCPTASRIRGNPDELDKAYEMRLAQRAERDAQFRRDGVMRGGHQTTRDRPLNPTSRDGEKRREDRLHPEFGGFFNRGTAPVINVPENKRVEKKEPVPETREELADRLEDEKIAASIRFLPRGAFDDHIKRMQQEKNPRIAPSFRPYLFSAAKQSNGIPMTPQNEDRCSDDVTRLMSK